MDARAPRMCWSVIKQLSFQLMFENQMKSRYTLLVSWGEFFFTSVVPGKMFFKKIALSVCSIRQTQSEVSVGLALTNINSSICWDLSAHPWAELPHSLPPGLMKVTEHSKACEHNPTARTNGEPGMMNTTHLKSAATETLADISLNHLSAPQTPETRLTACPTAMICCRVQSFCRI